MQTHQRLTLVAPINSYTSYGMLSIQYARALERLTGAFISIRSLSTSEAFGATIPPDTLRMFVGNVQPEPWELLLHPPNYPVTPGKKTAYFTMWEAPKLPPRAVELLNQATVVITPSDWGISCFSACGVTAPLRKVQLGISPVFKYRAEAPYARPTFVFGTAGRMAHGGVRKGVNAVIAAFLRSFPSDPGVELHVKGFPDCPIQAPSDARIKVTKSYLSEDQMSDWFAGVDCFVSAARGEGWGLMQQQAMATGLPVICPAFSGVTEFFNESVGYPLPYDLLPTDAMYTGCGHWAVAREPEMVNLMHHVYNNRHEAHAIGAKAHMAVSHLTEENSNRALATVLHEFGAV